MKRLILSVITASLLAGCGGSNSGGTATKPTVTNNGTVFKSTCPTLPSSDQPLTFTVEGDTAKLSGTICTGSPAAFDSMMSHHNNIKLLNFVDIPGSYNDEANLKLAYKVRAKSLNSFIDSDGDIASGGTDLFLAGVKRTVASGASIGVHSWSDGSIDGASLPRDPNHAEHKPYIEYYKAMGLSDPAGFYFFTLDAAPSNKIHVLTAQEIKTYGFSTVAIEKITDPRATFSPTYSELANPLFDAISDTKHGLNTENNVRTNALVIDDSISFIFEAFNVSTVAELETLLKTTNNTSTTGNLKATLESDGSLKIETISDIKIEFSGDKIIEHEKGIADFIKPEQETNVLVRLKGKQVEVNLFGEKFTYDNKSGIKSFEFCAKGETSSEGATEVNTRFCTTTTINAADVTSASKVTITTKNIETGDVTENILSLKHYDFEFNAKQSTLTQI